MVANKFTLTITVEALSMDSMPCLLLDVIKAIQSENHNGRLTASDGDTVSWKAESKEVEF